MDKVEGSKRLKKISEHVKKGEPILDIGSDHAYLPIYLVKEKLVPKAIAGELVKGPFQKAKHEVIKHDLEEKIDVRFGDGFNVLKKEEIMGSIFICGMGGLLISEIIE
ncbi:MAG: class I SAM-dependent methyltransferase, partial [Atopostipes suicloacalis]|nr:class I SAM-dependent methyltransferase [Atopostipes suicloacalis]